MMDQSQVKDNAADSSIIHAEDDTIYLFGSELYCGWCLEAFTCPLRLKIHCYVEHLIMCSCGDQYRDRQTLSQHIMHAGCLLPPPFKWSHFMKFPPVEEKEVCSNDEAEYQSLDESGTVNEESRSMSVEGVDESIQTTYATQNGKTLMEEPKQNEKFRKIWIKFRCSLCPFQAPNRTSFRKHMRSKHAKKPEKSKSQLCNEASKATSDDSVGPNTEHTNPSLDSSDVCEKVPCEKSPLLEEKKKFCCEFCPFQSSYRSAYRRHMQRKHAKKRTKSLSKSSSNEVQKATSEDTVSPYNGHTNPTVGSSEVCPKVPCENHRIGDIEFIVSCFSSPLSGKPLCCDLCDEKFGEWEVAAMHVYRSHLSAIQRWRDTREGNAETHPVSDNSSHKHSADKVVVDQDEKMDFTSEHCAPDKSENGVSTANMEPNDLEQHNPNDISDEKLDSGTAAEHCAPAESENGVSVGNMEPNDSEYFSQHNPNDILHEKLDTGTAAEHCALAESENGVSVSVANVEQHDSEHFSQHSPNDASVDQSNIPPPENIIRHKLTVDECGVLASTLCKLFNCVNHELELSTHEDKADSTLNTTAATGVTLPDITSDSKPTKTTSDMISKKCEFCHKVFYNIYNCQRHALSCPALKAGKSNTKSEHRDNKQPNKPNNQITYSFGALRKINGTDIFYCLRCGFSDTDESVVKAHLLEPHIVKNRKLQMKALPGHDYVGSMRLTRGNFQCSLCGIHTKSRSKMLKHLGVRHSSPAESTESASTAKQESASSVEMKESTDEQGGTFSSASSARSCPKCCRSFASVAKYLSHRAVCRTIQHRQPNCADVPLRNYSLTQHRQPLKRRRTAQMYLINFCEQAADGRWKCKLCGHHNGYRGDVYKHIRAKHGKLAKPEPEMCSEQEVEKCSVDEFSEKTADGLWQCKLCSQRCTYRSYLRRHLAYVHKLVQAADVSESSKKPETTKLNTIIGYCKQTVDGQFKCTLCSHSTHSRNNLDRHIREAHGKVTAKTAKLGTTSPRSAVPVSSSSVRKYAAKKTAVLGSMQKSGVKHFVKQCPSCSHVFMLGSAYMNHVKWCDRLGRFMETMSCGRVKCRLCNLTYGKRSFGIRHLRIKHLLPKEQTRDNVQDDVGTNSEVENPQLKIENRQPTSAPDVSKDCSDTDVLVIKVEK